MSDFQTQYALWDEFLTVWPASRLATMTLDEYTQAGSKDSFTYWIEARLAELGSIWGGSSFKFSVFSRKNTEVRESAENRSYSDTHGWYSALGTTAEDAFEKVRGYIGQIAALAANGDLDWRARWNGAGAMDLDAFTAHVHAAHLPHAVIIDCSANPDVAERYAGWLAAGIHVITPNKQAGSGPIERYRTIRAAAKAGNARFRYEATVGAGLPVIQTLRDLLTTGDELHAIEGIFSGTLAWLFNKYDGSQPFSALVREAHALGYTEPDPRDDLSGTDVARKLVILAREAGRELSLADVEIESLIPPGLEDGSAEDFLGGLTAHDAAMQQRFDAARARGEVLRYVATLDRAGRARVALLALPGSHAFAHLKLTDNVVQFTTRRYSENAMVVQGPGAGPEVTAAGVFSDLLRVAAALGARV